MPKIKLTVTQNVSSDGIAITSWTDGGTEYFHFEKCYHYACRECVIGLSWKKNDSIDLEWLINWINEFTEKKSIDSFNIVVGLPEQARYRLSWAANPLSLDDLRYEDIDPYDDVIWFRAELGPFTIYFEPDPEGQIGLIAEELGALVPDAEEFMKATALAEVPFTVSELENIQI